MNTERAKWFNDRIGKVVYRNKTSCDCETCEDACENGLTITDEVHADYIRELESIYNYEGSPLKYFDTIEERDAFEKELTIKK